MYLSNRLTFSLFSVLLVAALAFVATPAMAQVTVTPVRTAATATDAKDTQIIVFTYSVAPDPVPSLSDFTVDDGATGVADADDEDDTLASPYSEGTTSGYTAVVTSDSAAKTVTLTFTAPDNTSTVAVPAELKLKGYTTDMGGTNVAEDGTTPALVLLDGYIGGKTYVVYVRGDSATQAATPIPVLPSSLVGSETGQISDAGVTTASSQLVRTIFVSSPAADTDSSNMALPDLEEFFNVGGGTINLNVEGTAKDSRHLIINEIMWGVDNSRVGQPGFTSQQWIEVYNRLTTPAPAPTFEFIDDEFPAPATTAGTSDRISNIAEYQNVWKPPIKGSSGTATRGAGTTPGTEGDINGANPAFVSIYRNPDKQNADGANAGHWTASNRAYFPGFLGTPGSANTRGGLPTARPNPPAYTPPKNKLIINEVYNSATNPDDWLELRNVSGADVNLKGWRLSHTTGNSEEETLILRFPNDRTIKAGEVLLIVNKDPADSNLIAGIDITVTSAGDQQKGAGTHKYLNVKRSDNKDLHIPNLSNGGYLILREPARANKNADNDGLEGRVGLHDVIGPSAHSYNTLSASTDIKEPETGHFWKTETWPINGQDLKPHTDGGTNNNNAFLDPDQKITDGKVWARNGTAHGWRKGGGGHVGYVGGLGYARNHEGAGTPGYHNDVVKDVVANLEGKLVISELMLTTDDGHYPQWIELHNTSKTHGIDTADPDGKGAKTDWKIRFENHNSGKWRTADTDKTVVEFNLKDLFRYIPPNQTVLIVADTARYHSETLSEKTHFPDHRVASIFGLKQDDFLIENRRSDPIFLNAEGGFYIKITDASGAVSDEIGNLDGKKAEVRNDVPYDDAFGWNWPTEMTEGNRGGMVRTSLIRLKNADGTYRAGTPIRPVEDDPDTDADETVEANETRGAVVPLGTPGNMFPMDAAWVHAADTKAGSSSPTYYGSATDQGTPGHTANTPLPVELSFFRPTLEDGQVTIQWTTESELDNAGFNILRSDSRNGEFRQVNEQMIQGKGTTAERSSYKWVDTTAKPGAVYYYQIEDVSFAGEHTKLATTKLKGLISAKGKLTTSWGDIKDASQ